VEKTDTCWVWKIRYKGDHRPYFATRRGVISSARFAWEITNGEVPDDLCILHKCDNKQCVNPAHLFLGTQSDNLRDFWKKKKQKRREEVRKMFPNLQINFEALNNV
jgi:hypothetical protein